MKKEHKKKCKQAKDLNRCCAKCKFYDSRNIDDPICSLTAESVSNNNVCKKFNTDIYIKCSYCGKDQKYSDKEHIYDNTYLFKMEAGLGSLDQQRIHLCRKCQKIAFEKFCDFLDDLKKSL